MPEIISTPTALVQTQNGKRFYVNSGEIGVVNADTHILNIANIGERDIIFKMNPFMDSVTTDNLYMKVKNNGVVIYDIVFDNQRSVDISSPIHFIIPANTSLEILMANQTSTSRNVGVSCYGKYI